MVMLFRCRICGDPYVGERKPSRCPWCGAYKKYIVEAKDYKETFDVKLKEIDMQNVQKALEIELSNASFYFCAAKKSDTEEGQQLFKALGKVEAEHASIWTKILKAQKQDIPQVDSCANETISNLKESHDREERAIKFYTDAANQSKNGRVKKIFRALIDVENDHLKLSEAMLND
ncbi:MAG: ferritin family protein [Candidatus Woesearchaeota archaeon]